MDDSINEAINQKGKKNFRNQDLSIPALFTFTSQKRGPRSKNYHRCSKKYKGRRFCIKHPMFLKQMETKPQFFLFFSKSLCPLEIFKYETKRKGEGRKAKRMGKRKAEKKTEIWGDTGQKDVETHIDTDIHTHIDTYTHRHTQTQAHIQTHVHIHIYTHVKIHIHT